MSELETLARLRDADRWLDRLKAQRDHLPELAELDEVEHQLRVLADRLRDVEADRRPTREAFQAAVDRAESLRQRRRDLEARLGTASGPGRDLAAMSAELDRLVQSLSEAEDSEVALLLELEPLEELTAEIKGTAQPLVARRAELQAAVRDLRASLDDELAHRREERQRLARELPAALFTRYESALTRAGVSGAAGLDGTRCDGCRVALSPADVDRFKAAGEGQFMDCPHCGRLLLSC